MAYANLQGLVLSRADDTMHLYFDNMETLLHAKAIIAEALPDVKIEVESDPNTLMVRRPDAVVDLVRLWFGASLAEVRENPSVSGRTRKGTKAEQIIEMLQRPDGASADEIAEAMNIKKNSAVARISVETRRRDLTPTLKDGRYHL